MLRLYTIGTESAAASVLLIPLLWTSWEIFRRNMTMVRKGLLTVFAGYLCAVCSATGLPTAGNLHFSPRLNLIPFIDIVNEPALYLLGSFLNIVMFIPFGLLIPLLWRQLRSLRKAAVASMLFSLFIEMAQMFSGRLTDVDDLIFNTLGGVIGFLIARAVYRKVAIAHDLHDYKNSYGLTELAGMICLCVMAMYYLRPLIEQIF